MAKSAQELPMNYYLYKLQHRKTIAITVWTIRIFILGIVIIGLWLLMRTPSYAYYERNPVLIPATIYAYASFPEFTDNTPFLTAAGTQARDGVAACPSKLSFGTKIKVGGKIYACEDRMAKKYRDGNNFDLWFSSKEEARQWGKQELAVEIL